MSVSQIERLICQNEKFLNLLANPAEGKQGPRGAQGLQGLQGVQGIQGPPGEDGEDGEDGAMGPQGIPGPTGIGLDGSQGIQGIQGEDGPFIAGTIEEFRDEFNTDQNQYYIIDPLKEGWINYNPALVPYHAVDAPSGIQDDNCMYYIKDGKVYERRFYGWIHYEWFGVAARDYVNETVKMQQAVDFLISKGGGLIKLKQGTYTGSVVWNGDDNISISGLGGHLSVLYGGGVGQFAIKIEGGYPALGTYYEHFGFYGGDDKSRDGMYVNQGSSLKLKSVTIQSCGVGILTNGTIDNIYQDCMWRGNYVGIIAGTFNAGNTTITNIAGRTLSFSAAFTDTHPSEQSFIACRFFVNTFGIVIDYPAGGFPSNANVKFWGGQAEGNSVLFYNAQSTGMAEYPTVFENIWFETQTSLSNTYQYKSMAVPQCDIYATGGRIIVRNGGISCAYILNIAHLEVENTCFFRDVNYFVTVSGSFPGKKGSITGKGAYADGMFLPHFFKTGHTMYPVSRAFAFYTVNKIKRNISLLPKKVYSNDCTVISPALSAFGTITITKVKGGLIDGVCNNMLTTAASAGLISAAFVPEVGKFYASTITIRSVGDPFNILLSTSGGTGTIISVQVAVTPEWKTICAVGQPTNNGSDSMLIYKTDGEIREFQISGWQILKFDTLEELYAFQESDLFVVDDLDFSVNQENSSTSVPSKATLNSTYGVLPPASVITYKLITGGARDYFKESDSITSDWVETIWSTGVKSLAV